MPGFQTNKILLSSMKSQKLINTTSIVWFLLGNVMPSMFLLRIDPAYAGVDGDLAGAAYCRYRKAGVTQDDAMRQALRESDYSFVDQNNLLQTESGPVEVWKINMVNSINMLCPEFLNLESRGDMEENKSCSYNGKTPIPSKLTWRRTGFTINWSDGPRMSYTWNGRSTVFDSLGGRWSYQGVGNLLEMNNLGNGNSIRCK